MKNSTLAILTNPNPLLRRRAAIVSEKAFDQLRRESFLERLVATMISSDGVGIAATQVGISARIIVVLEDGKPRIYVNPEIKSRSLHAATDIEGCLSVPGVIGAVARAKTVTVRARDEKFKPITKKYKDLAARIFQHEVDHLNGILFIDKALRLAPTIADM